MTDSDPLTTIRQRLNHFDDGPSWRVEFHDNARADVERLLAIAEAAQASLASCPDPANCANSVCRALAAPNP